MRLTNLKAALPLTLSLCLVTAISTLATAPAVAATTLPTQSWNGYKWARTGQLAIQVGNNLSSAWQPYLAAAATQWSADSIIDLTPVAGQAPTSACSATYGTVQICDANYGANGWLGYTNVYTSGGFVVMATIKLNDYYFAGGKYSASAWMAATVCHELGHSIGLDHSDSSRTNLNTGNCLDISNDATGTKGTNGTLANTAPTTSDFTNLDAIYANLNTTQLASTKPVAQPGSGSYIEGWPQSGLGAVPEPSSWAMLLVGFGLTGSLLRRRRGVVA